MDIPFKIQIELSKAPIKKPTKKYKNVDSCSLTWNANRVVDNI
jgi:hypothetical protein